MNNRDPQFFYSKKELRYLQERWESGAKNYEDEFVDYLSNKHSLNLGDEKLEGKLIVIISSLSKSHRISLKPDSFYHFILKELNNFLKKRKNHGIERYKKRE